MKFKILAHARWPSKPVYTSTVSIKGRVYLALPDDYVGPIRGFEVYYVIQESTIEMSASSMTAGNDGKFFAIREMGFYIEDPASFRKTDAEDLIDQHILPLVCYFFSIPLPLERSEHWKHDPTYPRSEEPDRKIRRDV